MLDIRILINDIFFQLFEYVIPLSSSFLLLNDKVAVGLIWKTQVLGELFFSCYFHNFPFAFAFQSFLNIMWLDVDLFGFILLRVLYASWLYTLFQSNLGGSSHCFLKHSAPFSLKCVLVLLLYLYYTVFLWGSVDFFFIFSHLCSLGYIISIDVF